VAPDPEASVDVDLLEDQAVTFAADEVCLDVDRARDAADLEGGADEVGALECGHAVGLDAEAVGVEGAALVLDQDDAVDAVGVGEELELADDAFLLEAGLGVSGETAGAAGQGDAVVAGEFEPVLQEIVEMLADSSVGAVDGGGVHAFGVVFDG